MDNYSYVNVDLLDNYGLRREVHAESWLVQLATGTMKIFHHRVRAYAFELNYMPTSTHLNVLPLGSYNMLLGIDWLYLHRTKIDCYDKAIECLDDDGKRRILQGKKNSTLVIMVIAMQANHNCMKECVLFAVHVSSDKGKDVKDVEVLKRYLVL